MDVHEWGNDYDLGGPIKMFIKGLAPRLTNMATIVST